jgi:proteasome accessory factor B
LLKLRAAGVDVDPDAPIAITSPAGSVGLRGSEGVLNALLAAITAGQAVQFPHRPSRIEPYTVRTVEPWGVVTEKGRWYLVGHDRDRDATRTFRLSRIGAGVTPIGSAGAVTSPKDVDLRDIVAKVVGDAPTGVRAQVWVADGRATALRRAGSSLGARRINGRDGDVIEVEIGSTGRLTRDIAGYAADAVVLEPATLRDEVLELLRAHVREGRS